MKFLEDYGKTPEPEEKPPPADPEEARRRRRIVAACALGGLLILGGVFYFLLFGPTPLELKARRYSLPEREYADGDARLTLPAGWVMLQRDNPFLRIAAGRAYAIHPRTGCTAVFVIEDYSDGYVERALNEVVGAFRVGGQRVTERERQHVAFGGREGRRATFDLWRDNAIREVVFATAANGDGRTYYLLGVTPLAAANASRAECQELERGLHLPPAQLAQ